ncbi:unspecific monooxygenase, partial [Ostertagia ostertagi]
FPWLWWKPIWYLSGNGFVFDRLVKLTNDFTRTVIADRKSAMEEDGLIEGNEGDSKRQKLAFLDLLLRLQHSNQLSDEDIREEVDTFMFEGHDTTSSGIGFTVWWLGQSPECQKKLHEELDSVLVTIIVIDHITHGPHSSSKSGDTTLPEGLTVVMLPTATARDPRYWERPEDFYPEHFDADKVAGRDPFSYIPFSAGPRNCIGQKFALLEEKVVLSWIFRRFHVETEEPSPGNRAVPEIILKPCNGFRVRLTKR